MGFPQTASNLSPEKLRIVLIRPSKYDEEGYVIRHLRGVLPSNTLACLYGLTEELRERQAFGSDIEIEIQILDDTVQKIPVRRIIKSNSPPHRQTVVALVGVQSNQFPRAADLARQFRESGLQVLIGGFHISGSLSLFPEIPPEIRELMDLGVAVVAGEVEETWVDILRDALEGRLQPLYNFLGCKPDLSTKPVPRIHQRYLRRFIARNYGTIDCGRGCPYRCSFCTIINVQGQTMRFRSTETIIGAIRDNYRRYGVNYYFFTDDNFARNALWREIFQELARLRDHEGIPIRFMIQVDTQAYRLPGFIPMAARAGCTQVFIGLESINPRNLQSAGKSQNRVQDYKDMIAAWHESKIATHVAYIIGFPFDTAESVHEDIDRLKSELKVQQASFFMLTPLPGSQDHLQMVQSGQPIDPDLNNYDAFHETMPHPRLKPGEWTSVYQDAWRNFYSFDYFRQVLADAEPENYWNIFRNFIWYRNSVMIEGGHPMIHGFLRIKERKDKRPGFPVESRLRHFRRRVRDWSVLARGWLALILEAEELWLQTRKRSEAELRLMVEVKRIREEVHRNLHAAELQIAHIRAKAHFPGLRVPSRLALRLRNVNFGIAARITDSRADLQQFWDRTRQRLRQGQVFRIRPLKVAHALFRDTQLLLLFALAFMRGDSGNGGLGSRAG
jgi:radical SAM superfamily enzyme YgiQ (UPF0313 family)